ncbi:receptor tyrosine-protein kinase erbB-3-like isoform X3 [Halichondria panicea]|uniref:receptor tyrosine-protein kinase erbB-3-like isoform X3 n=1 Tax=Halichondria panicea TaxID=6063 RepID=UPI00312BA025
MVGKNANMSGSKDFTVMELLQRGTTNTRICLNGDWTDLSLYSFCFNLPEIADRNLEYDTKEDPFIGTRPNGTVATFTCMDGFILDGTTNTRICLNGGWTGTERVCLKAFCSDLPQVVNGDIMYNLTEDLLNATNLKQNGTVATYICPSRFRLDGNATRTCFNGDWTATAPVCIATFCSNLSQIDHGDLVYDNGGIIGFTLNDTKPNGTVASYSCSSGFSINTPDSTRICFDGDWTGTEPACISNLAIDNNTLATFTSVGVVGALVLLVITVGPCICACIYARLRRNKAERLRVSTIRMRKLSDRSNLMDYQMREIVKYVPESMRIPSSNLKLQDPVGQGAFGIVYKGLLMDWNNVAIRGVALKTLKGLFSPSDVQSMVSEITKMQEFHHPHVMPLIGVCLDAGPGVSMVMPYMTNGSLLDYLKKERSALELAEGEDSEKVLAVRKLLLKMCHQIALGMAYLARHKFVHRDLAARNCMLDSNGDLKVGDFGLAEDVYGYGYFRQGDLEGVKLPYKWMAVESLNDAIFNEKTDVWSYGVTVWEVFSSGRTPYPGVDPMSLVALLREGKRLEPPQNTSCSTEMFSLMTSCWYEDSDERPSFDELAAELEKVLSTIVGYVELNMELVPITEDEHKYDHVHSAKEQKKLAETVAEDVAMEENAAYRISAEDQLQAEQVATETNFAYGLRNEIQVTDHFNSDPPKHNHEGYSDYRDPTGYAKILHRRSSHETSVYKTFKLKRTSI